MCLTSHHRILSEYGSLCVHREQILNVRQCDEIAVFRCLCASFEAEDEYLAGSIWHALPGIVLRRAATQPCVWSVRWIDPHVYFATAPLVCYAVAEMVV